MILAAIDIGSNAARLLITEVIGHNVPRPVYNKLNLFRVPLRLGFDVFESKQISPERMKMLLDTMMGFKYMMRAYKVEGLLACATSAMRDAENSAAVLAAVRESSGIEIEIISGDLEANMVYENHINANMANDHTYMYIDVGGGSTEISFFTNNKLALKQSFNIGTIRLLKKQVADTQWDEMKAVIKDFTRGQKQVTAIGTGGNINKVFSLSKRKDGKSLPLDLLRDYYKEFDSFTVEERIERYSFRSDRADVIVPALSVYINAMRWAGATEIFVPKIGLVDGLIKHLYQELITAPVPPLSL